MVRHFFANVTVNICVLLACLSVCLGQAVVSSYSVHPPSLSVPDGGPGSTRRSLMQFYDWTLICDEALESGQVVCNVTQAVWDGARNVVFSWSLAASKEGDPFMLLRTLPDTDKNIPVTLTLKTGGQSVKIPFIGCDQNICLAQTPVGPILTKAINNGSAVTVSYRTKDGKTIGFDTSFVGLKEAVASIK